MRSRTTVMFSILVGVGLTLAGSTALAQATRTWVSGVGDDVNPCSRTAPCKTFAGAISKTAAGGEINAIDSGGFGAVTITKALTIDAHNVMAGVLVSGTNGIIINAGATDVVTLRGLSITAPNNGLIGVKYLAGGTVHVEDCLISGFTQGAIDFHPAAGVAANLFVKRVTASGNSGGGLTVGGAGSPQAVVAKSYFFNDATGLHTTETARVTVHDSVFAGNSGYGIRAEGTSEVNMDHGLVTTNGVGVQGDSTVRLSEVMVGHNTTGLAGVKVTSFGNNRVAAGNGTNGAPATTLPQQ
ncbi:MAG: hypothetical protein JWN44_599 [Myxococcales bacterium]|nr:hypothetical protein [Myxococcales bacterium]